MIDIHVHSCACGWEDSFPCADSLCAYPIESDVCPLCYDRDLSTMPIEAPRINRSALYAQRAVLALAIEHSGRMDLLEAYNGLQAWIQSVNGSNVHKSFMQRSLL